MIVSVLHHGCLQLWKYDAKDLQFVKHGKVWSNFNKEEFLWIGFKAWEKEPINTYLLEKILDLRSRRSVAISYEFKIIIDLPKALTWIISESAQSIKWILNGRSSEHHGLYSWPHFANVSHSVLDDMIERGFPIKEFFLGPGGRFGPWRWLFIQYTTKALRVLRRKASWMSVICTRKVLNKELWIRMII